MKTLFTYFLIAVVLLQTLHQSILVSLYQYNKDFVRENFCENKTDESCNGKCFLDKQIKDVDDWDENIPQNLKDFSVLLYFVPFKNVFEVFTKSETILKTYNGFYLQKNPATNHKDIFHPPLI
jgi:hypothetical protein